MAMSVLNNSAAQVSLGELNKNINKLGKALAVVASSQKINSAKDDSASFAISEIMREKIRSLEQDVQNVQNGSSMLKVAEGGIQEQVEILKTIREKVIDAANDSNTDDDRRIIQKEINQLYDQIEQVAYYTEYNSKKVLLGDTLNIADTIMVPTLETIETTLTGSEAGLSDELDLIANVYKTLDGLTAGPFDTFKDYAVTDTTITALGLRPSITISADDYTATPYETAYVRSNSTAKITNWSNAADPFMDNRGFSVTTTDTDTGRTSTKYYVLTDSPGTNTYGSYYNPTEIDIRGCSTVAQVMAKIDDEIDAIKAHSGNKITVDKNATLSTWTQYVPRQATTSSAGPFSTQKNFSGAVYDNYWRQGSSGNDQTTPDRWYADYSKIKAGTASDTLNLNSLGNNTGFTVYSGNGSALAYVRFVDGPLHSDANTSVEVGYQYGDDGIVNVSKNYLQKNSSASLSFSAGSISVNITSSSVTVSDTPSGGYYNGANTDADKRRDYGFTDAENINKYYVRNGISAGTGSGNVRVRALSFDKQASDATFDLSDYQTTDPADLEKFIANLAGKAIKDDSYNNGYRGSMSSYTNSTNGWYYEFTDSASDDPFVNTAKIPSGYRTLINLNSLRSMVGTDDANGRTRTIADAFAELFDNNTSYGETVDGSYTTVHRITKNYTADDDETSGVKSITLQSRSVASADTTISAVEGVLRHYDLDFNKWFDTDDAKLLVEYDLAGAYLDGKGFRAFCATDNSEWFNFIFRDGEENFSDETFDSSPNIHSLQIDVSGVKSAAEMAQRIYDQIEPQLKEINHYMHLYIEKPGVLRIYDDRANTNYSFRYNSYYTEFQKGDGTDMEDNPVIGLNTENKGGAKLADGIIEKDGVRVVREKRLSYFGRKVGRTYIRNLQIQDTTQSSMNIRVKIPQMTLSNIFYPLPDRSKKVQDYDVMTRANRYLLLGDPQAAPPVKGILDQGMDYLLEANTLVGAQLARLEYSEANIVTTLENTQASDSVIRDADMAKAMTEYTKQNVLMQASQSMLAQANQNLSGVLSLLQ